MCPQILHGCLRFAAQEFVDNLCGSSEEKRKLLVTCTVVREVKHVNGSSVWAVILCVLCVCVCTHKVQCVYTQSAVCVYCLVCTVVCRPFLNWWKL